MNVDVTVEQRYDRLPDGTIWTAGQFPYRFWTRYLDVFEGVNVIARVRQVVEIPRFAERADGPRVKFVALPHYIGPSKFLTVMPGILRALAGAPPAHDAVVLRVPSAIAAIVRRRLRKGRRPYGVEVVGDPYEIFGPGAIRHPCRPVFRWMLEREQRLVCAGAAGAAYVTKEALQRRYPCKEYAVDISDVQLGINLSPDDENFPTHDSAVELDRAARSKTRTADDHSDRRSVVISVGSLNQPYKGYQTLIAAIAQCREWGIDLELRLVGDGVYKEQLQRQVSDLGLDERVNFLGQLPSGSSVTAALDRADLFVLPSLTEGLPRALIEAMARGLPCIGSDAGGIRELLSAEDRVPPGDSRMLARKIREVMTSPGRLETMAARNLARSEDYRENVLRSRRIAFYNHLRSVTTIWLTAQSGFGL
jgi:glycosyltransferase involved in cell wall biosynthesis